MIFSTKMTLYTTVSLLEPATVIHYATVSGVFINGLSRIFLYSCIIDSSFWTDTKPRLQFVVRKPELLVPDKNHSLLGLQRQQGMMIKHLKSPCRM